MTRGVVYLACLSGRSYLSPDERSALSRCGLDFFPHGAVWGRRKKGTLNLVEQKHEMEFLPFAFSRFYGELSAPAVTSFETLKRIVNFTRLFFSLLGYIECRVIH